MVGRISWQVPHYGVGQVLGQQLHVMVQGLHHGGKLMKTQGFVGDTESESEVRHKQSHQIDYNRINERLIHVYMLVYDVWHATNAQHSESAVQISPLFPLTYPCRVTYSSISCSTPKHTHATLGCNKPKGFLSSGSDGGGVTHFFVAFNRRFR